MNSSKQSIAFEGDRLLTEGEAAKFIAMSNKWLSNQRWMGLGPNYVRIGRCIRYRASELESFLSQCEVQSDWP